MKRQALRSILFLSCISMFSASLGACVGPDGGDSVTDGASALGSGEDRGRGGAADEGAPLDDRMRDDRRGDEPPPRPGDDPMASDDELPADEPVVDNSDPVEEPPPAEEDPMAGDDRPPPLCMRRGALCGLRAPLLF